MNIKSIIAKGWQVIYVEPKNWLCTRETDKVLHFTVSMILVQAFSAITQLWAAAIITFTIGILKEVLVDKLIMKEKVDIEDLNADLWGTLGGLFLIVLIYLLSLV